MPEYIFPDLFKELILDISAQDKKDRYGLLKDEMAKAILE